MHATQTLLSRLKAGLGLSCLIGTLVLSSPGVIAVRADEAPVDADPAKTSSTPEAKAPSYVPARVDGEIEMVPRPEDPRGEATGDTIVLNTRGYNYGPNRPTVRPVPATPPPAAAPESPGSTD